MKCIIDTSGKVRRLHDTIARSIVHRPDNAEFDFCPKWIWKLQNHKEYKGVKERQELVKSNIDLA